MATLLCLIFLLALPSSWCGDAAPLLHDPGEPGRTPPDDTLELGIILVSSEILECSVCSESMLRTISRLNQPSELDGMLAFIVPDHPLQTSESEYKIYARQALGFSSHNDLELPFFMLPRNIFNKPVSKSPLLLSARILNRPPSSKKGQPLSMINTGAATTARPWAAALHSGAIQLLLALALLAFALMKHRRYKKILGRLGEIHATWHPRRSLATREGRFQLLVWLIGGCAILFLLFTSFSPWLLTLLLLFVLYAVVDQAYSMVQAGKKGINNALSFIAWEDISRWRIDGKRHLLYLVHGALPPKVTAIGLPPQMHPSVQALLDQRIPQQEG